jgi:MFS transporter, NNP family, nitrate/nitrite transporter
VVKKASTSVASAASQPATYLLAFQYACSFGTELMVFNVRSSQSLPAPMEDARAHVRWPVHSQVAATYLHEALKFDPIHAGKLATLCGITNIFARGGGGWLSDVFSAPWGMNGRRGVQFALILCEAFFLILFSHANTQASATVLLVIFSIFVQAANGSCFAIVPYGELHERSPCVAGPVF